MMISTTLLLLLATADPPFANPPVIVPPSDEGPIAEPPAEEVPKEKVEKKARPQPEATVIEPEAAREVRTVRPRDHLRALVYLDAGLGSGERTFVLAVPGYMGCSEGPQNPKLGYEPSRLGGSLAVRFSLDESFELQLRGTVTKEHLNGSFDDLCSSSRFDANAYTADVGLVVPEIEVTMRVRAEDLAFYFGVGPRLGYVLASGHGDGPSGSFKLDYNEVSWGGVGEVGYLFGPSETVDVGVRLGFSRIGDASSVDFMTSIGVALY